MSTVRATEPLSAQDVADFFLRAILQAQDLRTAWTATDAPLRRALAESWVTANARHPFLAHEDHDQLAEELADIDPLHPLWPYFEESTLDAFFDAWQHVDLERWGWAPDPRPISLDHELVIFADPDSEQEIDGRRMMEALTWTMRYREDGWWVAHLSEQSVCPPSGPPCWSENL